MTNKPRSKEHQLRIAKSDDLPSLMAIDHASSQLFEQAGLCIELDDDHPFARAEAVRWSQSIDQGLVYVAMDANGQSVGFAVCSLVDDEPYLDQLSVLPLHMRQGIASKLIGRVLQWSAERPLWLTTYSSLPWNKPYYERHGFKVVLEASCGPGMQAFCVTNARCCLDQRTVLPWCDTPKGVAHQLFVSPRMEYV